MSDVKAIYGAMLKVQEGIGNVPKRGVMSFGSTSYNFLRADDVQEVLNPLLTEHKITVVSNYGVEFGVRQNRDYVYVNLALQYISAVDGSEYPVVTAVGEAIAGDDKSINKALTQAIKNAHRTTFQFSSGEVDSDEAPPAKPASAPAQKKVAQARKSRPVGGVNQGKIKSDWIDKGVVSREDVNTLYGRVKTDEPDLKGDAIFGRVIELLEKGEVG